MPSVVLRDSLFENKYQEGILSEKIFCLRRYFGGRYFVREDIMAEGILVVAHFAVGGLRSDLRHPAVWTLHGQTNCGLDETFCGLDGTFCGFNKTICGLDILRLDNLRSGHFTVGQCTFWTNCGLIG